MYDLSGIFTDGLGQKTDLAAAQEWYAKALTIFLREEQNMQEKQRPNLQYRVGKMFVAGLGKEHKVNCIEGIREGGLGQDYEKAGLWYTKTINANHEYAQHSLAGLYYRGQGVK